MELSITRSKSRVLISRLFGLIVVLLVLFTGHSFTQDGVLDLGFEVVGLLLLTVAALGRLWALLYVSGHKKQTLVATGPYSIMRHPLYFFSFVGVVGIGLASENLLVLILLVVFYVLYYPFAVRAEERKLIQKFGAAYIEYMAAVPAFLPKRSLYQSPDRYEVNATQFVRNFRDAIWFIWIFPLLHVIEAMQHWGIVPVLWKVP